MQPLKRTSGFFLLCMVIYAVLMASWPGVREAYRACFCAGNNLLFGTFGELGATNFSLVETAGAEKDTLITFRKRMPGSPTGRLEINTAHIGYRPTVFLIALTLATPIAWRRRWRALVWGLIFVNGYIAVRVGVFILDAFSNADPIAIYRFAPSTKAVLKAINHILFISPGMHYMGAVFVWLAVTFRRGDLEEIYGRPLPDQPAKSTRRRSKRRT